MKKIIEKNKDKLIKDVLDIVAIESVHSDPLNGMPNGEKVNDALMQILELGKSYGFKTKNIKGHAGIIEYGEGEDYVAVLGHLDVVPLGKGWKHNPLGEIVDDRIYGRGTMDDKGPMIAALHGLIAIKEMNIPLKHRIRLIFGTSEEIGGPDIENYLKYEKEPILGFTPDAEFPAIHAEMGILVLRISKDIENENNLQITGGEAVNMVPDKAVIKYDLGDKKIEKSYKGKSAHGSTPHLGENAITKLLKDIEDFNIDNNIKDALREVSYNLCHDLDGKVMGIDFEDESGKLVLNTGIIKLKENKLDVDINIRYPVTFKEEDIVPKIESIFKEKGFEFKVVSSDTPLYYKKDDKLIKKLMKVYVDETGDEREAIAIGGGTYAKAMKNIVAFGPQLPGRPDVIHQLDEYILIEDLLLCANIYGRSMIELSK